MISYFELNKCDWLWENPLPLHKDKYLEIRNNQIIISVISWEGLKLQESNLPQIYTYSRPTRLSSLQCKAIVEFPRYKHLYWGGG